MKGAGTKCSQTQVIPKSSGLKTLARSVGRKNRASIARQVMNDHKMKDKALDILGRQVQKEMSAMCSKKKPSVLRGDQLQDLKDFTWEMLEDEAKLVAPTLHRILKGMVEVKRRIRCPKSTRSKKRVYGPSNTAVMGMCMVILLRHKNAHINLVQKIISLILRWV